VFVDEDRGDLARLRRRNLMTTTRSEAPTHAKRAAGTVERATDASDR
jgi:hypothetical protein